MTRVTNDSPVAVYREVRGLSRGLAVLRALNAMPGGIGGVMELARMTGLHRTTVKRLLETLRIEGLVQHRDEGLSYALRFEVRRLSEGYVSSDWIDHVAVPAMRTHLRTLSWPSDLATPDAGFMIVRESTHRISLLSQHRAMIGNRIPMLISALGRAWLSWCTDGERQATLALLRERTDAIGEMAKDDAYVKRILRETRRRGYALNKGEWAAEANITAIGLPIRFGEHVVGAVNLIMPSQLVSDREIATRYVPLLRSLADEISKETAHMQRG
ncbi:DNA-binding transcriptional regulator [Alcaligenaceae bacterium CGII-47]|nr:DNA-binding transcriptional regulator [Alcaligenaceae bacterium CGII-47]